MGRFLINAGSKKKSAGLKPANLHEDGKHDETKKEAGPYADRPWICQTALRCPKTFSL